MEELDEDIAVTQTQVIFTCPLTLVDFSSLLMSYFYSFKIVLLQLFLIPYNNTLVSVSSAIADHIDLTF